MPLPIVATDYRDKARNCRFLAATAEVKIAKQLFFLAKEYDAAAYTREQSDLPTIDGVDCHADVSASRIQAETLPKILLPYLEAPLHRVRAVLLSSYVAVANDLGIDGNRLLAEANIRRSDLEDGEARLPAGAVIGLLERSAERSGCDSFGIRMAQCRSFASRGPVSLLLQHLETVGEVVDASILFRRNFGDVAFVALEREKDVSLIHLDLIPPYNTPQAADLTIAIDYVTLVGASEGRWAPEAVHFTHKPPKDRARFESFFRAPLEFGSHFNGLSCSTASLDIPLPLADRAMASNARRLLQYVKLPAERASVSDHTRHSIGLMLPSGHATLESVAAHLDQNGRSLQRNLENEGHTFGDLLNEVRRGLAQQYLAGSTQPIIQISDILGYATASSFTRWFHGEFGASPKDWRAAQLETVSGPPALLRV